MEIAPPRGRRWVKFIGYLAGYLAAGIFLVLLFRQFGTGPALAAGLAIFMLAYMTLMAAVVGKGRG